MTPEILTAARVAAGLTLQEAATAAGVAVSSWWKWEHGDLPMPALPVVAPALYEGAREAVAALADAALAQMEGARSDASLEAWASGRRELLGLDARRAGLLHAAWVARLPQCALALRGDAVQLAPPAAWTVGWFTPADLYGEGAQARQLAHRLRSRGAPEAVGATWMLAQEARLMACGVDVRSWARARGLTYNQALVALDLHAHNPAVLPGVEALKLGKSWRIIDPS